MVAILSVSKIDLEWADNQYWTTLFNVIGEINKLMTPKKKEKLKASEAQNYIK